MTYLGNESCLDVFCGRFDIPGWHLRVCRQTADEGECEMSCVYSEILNSVNDS